MRQPGQRHPALFAALAAACSRCKMGNQSCTVLVGICVQSCSRFRPLLFAVLLACLPFQYLAPWRCCSLCFDISVYFDRHQTAAPETTENFIHIQVRRKLMIWDNESNPPEPCLKQCCPLRGPAVKNTEISRGTLFPTQGL